MSLERREHVASYLRSAATRRVWSALLLAEPRRYGGGGGKCVFLPHSFIHLLSGTHSVRHYYCIITLLWHHRHYKRILICFAQLAAGCASGDCLAHGSAGLWFANKETQSHVAF